MRVLAKGSEVAWISRFHYAFYPVALPHWIAWVLFSLALAAAACLGLVRGRQGRWGRGLWTSLIAGIAALLATMVASMVITFFVHDL